jgi:hypothetical protein
LTESEELLKTIKIAEMVLQKPICYVKELMLTHESIVRAYTNAISKTVCFLLCVDPAQRFTVRDADLQLCVPRFVRSYIRNLLSYPVAAYKCDQSQNGYDRNYDVVAETPNILFHGTNTLSLPDINRRGLDPALAGRCWTKTVPYTVHLTDSMLAAEFHARNAVTAHSGDPVILRINVKNFKQRFIVHTNFGQVDGAFDMYTRFASREILPPNLIRNRYVFPQQPSLYEILRMLISGKHTFTS